MPDENLEFKSKFISDRPFMFSQLEIDLTGMCNRTCSFCPRGHGYENTEKFFPLPLWWKILREIPDYDGLITFSGFGEPLLHRGIYHFIADAKRLCPKATTEVITNGDYLTPETMSRLFSSGLNRLLISLYNNKYQNIKFGLMRFRAGVPEDSVVLRNRYDGNQTFNNRGGLLSGTPALGRCYYPFYMLYVDYNGNFLACSNDWRRRNVVGDAKWQTIMEVWNSQRMESVRRVLSEGHRDMIKACDDCNADGKLMGEEQYQKWEKGV